MNARGGPDPERKIRMVGNGGPINGRLIHRVTKYSAHHDACIKFSFPVLLIVIIQIGLS